MSKVNNGKISKNSSSKLAKAIENGFANLANEIKILKQDILQILANQQTQREYLLKKQVESERRMQQQMAAFFQHSASYFTQIQQNSPCSYPVQDENAPPVSIPGHVMPSMMPIFATPQDLNGMFHPSIMANADFPPAESPQSTLSSSSSPMTAHSPGYSSAASPEESEYSPSTTHSSANSSPKSNSGYSVSKTNRSYMAQQQYSQLPSAQDLQPSESYHSSGSSDSVGFDQSPDPEPVPLTTIETDSAIQPVYQLSRSVNSIAEVWEEYCNGIDGGPSIKDLEIAYGREWRVDPGESRFFSRRKTIYREIRRLAGIYNISCEDAVRKLEKQRERMRKSVDDMGRYIKKRNESRMIF